VQRICQENALPATATALKKIPTESKPPASARLDWGMLAGIAIALAATAAGIRVTGVSSRYFLQPAGLLIVMGATLGVTLLTTPMPGLTHCARRLWRLLRKQETDRAKLIEQIVGFVRPARTMGLVSLEPSFQKVENHFLRDSLLLMLEVRQRPELQSALELKLRMQERQGLADAKVLEVAGGFAPAIGVLGTVVGLIDVLRQFSNVSAVAGGVGTAFLSTIYGLALANLILLPAAHRIHARVAEEFETNEMITEGVLCMLDVMHPSLVRERLNYFLRIEAGQ